MSKLRNSILIFGILILCVAIALVTFLTLSATGFIAAEPIALTVRVRSVTEPYNAAPHRATSFDIIEGELIKGHTVEALTFTGEQTNVGDCDSSMTLRVLDEDGADVSGQYKIRIQSGTVTVTPRTITVNQENIQADYTGGAVVNDRFVVLEENGLCEGHRLTANPLDEGVTFPTSRPVASEYEPVIYDAAGNNVTANYDMTFTAGTVSVRKRLLTVAPVSVERTYNGSPLVPENYTLIAGSLMDGHEIVGVQWEFVGMPGVTGLTDVGTASVRVSGIELRDANADEFYTVMSTTATVTVTPKPVVIEGKSKTWQYVKPLSRAEGTYDIGKDEIDTDEKSDTYKYYTIKNDEEPKTSVGIVDGDILKLTYSAAINDVGEKTNDFTYSITRKTVSSGAETVEDVSGNYIVSTVFGMLKVEPRTIKIDLETAFGKDGKSEDYNGKTHDVLKGVDLGKLLSDNGLAVSDLETTEEIKNAKEYSVSLKIKDEKIAKNYNLEVTEGKYVVNKAALPEFNYGKDNKISKVYDGKPAVFDCVMAEFVVDEQIPEDERMPEIYFAAASLNVEGNPEYYKKANEGKYPYIANIVTAVVRDKETGENVTANYDFSAATVNIEIKKRKLTVTANTVTLDAFTLVSDISDKMSLITITGDGLIGDDKIDVEKLNVVDNKYDGNIEVYILSGFAVIGDSDIGDSENYRFEKDTVMGSVIRISGGGNSDV